MSPFPPATLSGSFSHALSPLLRSSMLSCPSGSLWSAPLGVWGPPSRVGRSPWPRCVLILTSLCRTNGAASFGRRRT
eukprot:68011-Pyramimonas_sp.AAC.1